VPLLLQIFRLFRQKTDIIPNALRYMYQTMKNLRPVTLRETF